MPLLSLMSEEVDQQDERGAYADDECNGEDDLKYADPPREMRGVVGLAACAPEGHAQGVIDGK